MRKPYKRRMWGGFIDGRLHLWSNGVVGGYTSAAIYTNRQVAKRDYEDVRPLIVTEIQPRKAPRDDE